MTHSAIFEEAAARYKQMKADYWNHVETEYLLAERETNGFMVNRLGQEKLVRGTDLYRCNTAFAMKYASEELKDHWTRHPRPNLQDFERQWLWSFQPTDQ